MGPLENSTPTVMDSSFEFTVPKPKTPVLSNDATGTITFRRPKDPKPSAPSTTNDVERDRETVKDHATVRSTAICTQTDQGPQLDASKFGTMSVTT